VPTLVPITWKLQELLLNDHQVTLPSAPEYIEKDQEWRTRAACKGMDTDLFFPERGENLKVKKAKEICASCPVQNECLAYALQWSDNQMLGIWGGTSWKTRRTMPSSPDAFKNTWSRY
jgi:WhiB family redox-sensing transcriptional regulator